MTDFKVSLMEAINSISKSTLVLIDKLSETEKAILLYDLPAQIKTGEELNMLTKFQVTNYNRMISLYKSEYGDYSTVIIDQTKREMPEIKKAFEDLHVVTARFKVKLDHIARTSTTTNDFVMKNLSNDALGMINSKKKKNTYSKRGK